MTLKTLMEQVGEDDIHAHLVMEINGEEPIYVRSFHINNDADGEFELVLSNRDPEDHPEG
jgi:hypothetical protein